MYGILNIRRIRKQDFRRIEDRFATVFKRINENPDLSPEEQNEKITDILSHCTGPDVGIEYDMETGRISISEGWTVGEHGIIVKE